jgi:hypothetical protein
MPAPCDPESPPEAREEEQEIVLRLGDILPRVPSHLLKPGPHEAMFKIRFSVEELAEKISRGRASVPLERLASVCPEVFRTSSGFPGEQEIQLPLQKLLEQVGLVAPKGSSLNGMPKEQIAQARAEASRIIEAAAAAPAPPATPAISTAPVVPATPAVPVGPAPAPLAEAAGPIPPEGSSIAPAPVVLPAPGAGVPAAPIPSSGAARPAEPRVAGGESSAPVKADTERTEAISPAKPAGMAKAILAARQIFGLFTRGVSIESQVVEKEPITEEKTPLTEKKSSPSVGDKKPETAPALSSKPVEKQEQWKQPSEPTRAPERTVEPPIAAVPAGWISLRALPIFRLLPSGILRSGARPPEGARAVLPLSAIDPQIASGHVEIPLEDFIRALPEELRGTLNEVPGTQVWIPLDEVFQSLPPDHLFHMPPLDYRAEIPEVGVLEAPVAEAEPEPETMADNEVKKSIPLVGKLAVPDSDAKADLPSEPIAARADELPVEPPIPAMQPAQEIAPAKAASEETEESPAPSAPAIDPENSGTPGLATEAAGMTEPAPVEEIPAEVAVPESDNTETIPPVEQTEAVPAAPVATPAQQTQPASRAPWMRGFQVPPPRLFAGKVASVDAPAEAVSVEAVPQPAATPEAKRTVDFLANQNGIFAAAAFVEGAVFASEDFPRKPDLDALRDFMGSFVDHASESGRRLGWNRVVTIACENFYATAVARETHFIVALHHDRVLPTVAHEALISAADDLNRVG